MTLFFTLFDLLFLRLLWQIILRIILQRSVKLPLMPRRLQKTRVELHIAHLTFRMRIAEESHSSHGRLVTHRDVNLRFGLHFLLKVGDTFYYGNDKISCFHGPRLRRQSPLNRISVQPSHTDPHTITLSNIRHRFAEHLHRLDLLFEFLEGEFDGVAGFGLAGKNGSGDDGSLAFDLETMINSKQKVTRLLSRRHLQIIKHRLNKRHYPPFFHPLLHCHSGRHWHNR